MIKTWSNTNPDSVEGELVLPIVVDVRLRPSLAEGISPIPFQVYPKGDEPVAPPDGWDRFESLTVQIPVRLS